MLSLGLAICTLFIVLAFSLEMAMGALRLKNLTAIAPVPQQPLPLVSVIVPALNEETSFGACLRSLLALDYEPLEIIAINDRSSDQTGTIIDQMAQHHKRLKAMHIHELPNDWLGKHHALQRGAEAARGDLLLFTDADVKLETTTLKRAVHRLQAEHLDHLTLLFSPELHGGLLKMVVVEFGVTLTGVLKPWQAANSGSRRAIGIGAFNLVRRAAYEAVGGHRTIAMAPIDDIMLGVVLKSKGFRQECLQGGNFVKVPWYDSLGAMIAGLEKNSFAALDFSLTKVAGASVFLLGVEIWPYWALLMTEGPTRLVNGAIIGCLALLYGSAAHYSGLGARHLIWLPLAAPIRLYILWRSVVLTLGRGGITWRGTFYSLDRLKSHHRPITGERHD